MNSPKTFFILGIVITLLLSVTVSPISTGFAEKNSTSQNENLKIKAEILLEIAKKTKEYVNITLTKIVETPENVSALYMQAVILLENATKLYNEGFFEESSKLSVKAMQKLKKVIVEIQHLEKELEIEKKARFAIETSSAIARAKIFVEKIKNLANKTKEIASTLNYTINLEMIDEIVQNATECLQNATVLTSMGKVDEASKKIGETHKIVARFMGILQPIIKIDKERKAEKFINKTIQHLEKIEGKLNILLVNASPTAQIAVKKALENAQAKLLNIKSFLKTKNLDVVIKEIQNAKRMEEEAFQTLSKNVPKAEIVLKNIEKLEEIEELKGKIEMLRKMLKHLKHMNVQTSKIETLLSEAEDLLLKAEKHLEEGNLDKAKIFVSKAKTKIDEAEKLIGEISFWRLKPTGKRFHVIPVQ